MLYLNELTTIDLHLDDQEGMILCGANDRNPTVLSEHAHAMVSYRNGAFFVKDAENNETILRIREVLAALRVIASKGKAVGEQDVIYAWRKASRSETVDFNELGKITVGRTLAGRVITPKTEGQAKFVRAMLENTVVFATGPAGTGKTFLAVIEAVSALKQGEVKRLVLTRPAVEAGENLGFLPGDLKEKVDPYLRPLYDGLHVMLGVEKTEALIEKGTIEIAPLAYMRGRTLDDSYVILDEAQNTTISQMKMFLTRLGFHSHMVITGDTTQVDLDRHTESGLIQAVRILKDIHDIAIVELNADDIVRNPLVQKIIERYDSAGRGQKKKEKNS